MKIELDKVFSIKNVLFLLVLNTAIQSAILTWLVYDFDDMYSDIDIIAATIDRGEMYTANTNDAIRRAVKYDGLYFNNEFYCVWTKHRTQEQISNTMIHEECHALIDDDFEHFCEG